MHADVAGRRATLSLDGLWDFEFEGPAARLSGKGHTIRSPGIWQTQFPALRNAQGTGRHRRGVQVPPGWAGKRVVLVMEGVFHESVILVDEVAEFLEFAQAAGGFGVFELLIGPQQIQRLSQYRRWDP